MDNNTTPSSEASALTARSAAGGSQLDQLDVAAKKEGKIVCYSSITVNNLIQKFQKAYPNIGIDFVRLPADQLATCHSNERFAGSFSPTSSRLPATSSLRQPPRIRRLQPSLDSLAAASFPKKYISSGTAVTGGAPPGTAYNTNLVKNPPMTGEAALSPEYKGKVQKGNPNFSPTYLLTPLQWKTTYGVEFLHKLAGLDVKVQASKSTAIQNTAAGAADPSRRSPEPRASTQPSSATTEVCTDANHRQRGTGRGAAPGRRHDSVRHQRLSDH